MAQYWVKVPGPAGGRSRWETDVRWQRANADHGVLRLRNGEAPQGWLIIFAPGSWLKVSWR